MKRRFFIFSVIAIVVMAMSFVGCDKNETIEPSQTTKDNSTTLKTYRANYYPSSAVSYALDWTDNSGSMTDTSPYNNTVYKSYNPNDCANFVSQCLYAGGLYTDNTWYSNFLNWSPDAWINVEALHDYLFNSAYSINTQILSYPSSVTSYINSIYTGDIVFYYNYNQSKFDHVTIVTSKTSTDAKVSGHCANQKDHSLKYYLQYEKSNSNDYVVVLHFN